jgi:DNA-dependent protein kinase catalytic subunit
MDYFTLDLMVLLLSWHTVASPQATEKKLVNRLFENLIKRCYHENRAILKNNIELLKTMTEAWRELIELPMGLVHAFLTSEDEKKTATGVHLLSVVLANRIDSFEYPHELAALDVYKSLVTCMRHSSKLIHAPSAEVVGMLLRKLEKESREVMTTTASIADSGNESNENELFDQVQAVLSDLLSKLSIDMFITCVHRVQINYPSISEKCMAKLVYNLPRLYGEFKIMCAESILSSIQTIVDPLLMTVYYIIDFFFQN